MSSQNKKCSVIDCDNDAFRSLNRKDFSESEIKINDDSRRVYLCRDHYKIWKKELKKKSFKGISPFKDIRW